MRVLMITYGTEGDVRPFVALAQSLLERGHEAAVGTADGYADIVRGAGVPLLGFGNEMYAVMRTVMERSGGVAGVLRQYPRLLAAMEVALDEQWEVARAYSPDVVVFHPKPLAGPHIAERLGVPGLMAIPLPVYHPTRAYPSAMVPTLPRPLWPLSYRVAAASTRPYRGMLNRFRGRIGLGPMGKGTAEIVTPDGSPRHVLYAYSPSVVPVPPEYPPTAHVTGFWVPDAPAAEPSDEVRAFVEAGQPDLYLGFGSMAMGKLRERLSTVVADALRRTGVRAVVGAGWGGVEGAAMPDNALLTGFVPHDWLFPRVRAVVHHGGAGTIAGGLRAGRPTLVCPLLGDQPFWGRRMHEIGVGPRPIPMKRLTAARLATAITDLLGDASYAERAERLGERVRREDGTAVAAGIIESVVGDRADAS